MLTKSYSSHSDDIYRCLHVCVYMTSHTMYSSDVKDSQSQTTCVEQLRAAPSTSLPPGAALSDDHLLEHLPTLPTLEEVKG